MLRKLRLKFVLVNMVIVTCLLAVILSLVINHTGSQLQQNCDNVLQALAYGAKQPGDDELRLPHFVIQIDIHGNLSVVGNSFHDLKDEEFIQKLVQKVFTNNKFSGYLDEYHLRYTMVSGMLSQKLIFVDVSGQNAAMSTLIQASVFIGLAALVAMLVISLLLAQWAVKPVERAWEQQKQFISDASHELKTPLTVIMSNAELLQSPEYDEQTKTQFAGSILTMSQQMRNLVEGMLELARADNGQAKKTFEKLDMTGLVNGALLPFEPVFFERGLLLESDISEDIQINGNAGQLRQVLEIFLDNAAKYSAKGIVRVQLRRQGRGHCLLTVANPGEPIDQKDLKRIFERFYRADEARSRTGSFGLGLPIARTIVEEHKGKIWAVSNETGNCFCVSLPCAN
ncbi:MAG: HAMP domain-containing histidine kinase [Oscillospiraceae bacterium]|nr:HAMP domain-containing histidine kinase [Oscillospiraceae bacterium]